MAGYFIYSLDAAAFAQLTTAPTTEQCVALADAVVDDIEDMLDEYGDEDAADPAKWPRKRGALAKAIGARLAAADWYADLTAGDAAIWYDILRGLQDEPGRAVGIDFRCDNDGFLYWDAAKRAARQGAPMMAEPAFGNGGFRYSGKAKGDVELIYSIYPPPQVTLLLAQLEAAAPHFEKMPDDEEGDRAQFFRGLLEPVRTIAAEGRAMWVQTDT